MLGRGVNKQQPGLQLIGWQERADAGCDSQIPVAPDIFIDDQKERVAQQRQGLDGVHNAFQPAWRFG